ncbi:hypothetical protein [Penaeicola halotolerans]|uniref:hypothetical protein n=1 Tax=Penaeicola halotolerans TaxID=2793196 RepID=UPI001CF8ACCB|nr:hypothetical protein [Penaeicola halotolerans]
MMKKETAEARLQEIKDIPKYKYVLKYGILRFGILVALMTPVVTLIMDGVFSFQALMDSYFNVSGLVRFIVQALVGGILYGLYLRYSQIKMYERVIKSHQTFEDESGDNMQN